MSMILFFMHSDFFQVTTTTRLLLRIKTRFQTLQALQTERLTPPPSPGKFLLLGLCILLKKLFLSRSLFRRLHTQKVGKYRLSSILQTNLHSTLLTAIVSFPQHCY